MDKILAFNYMLNLFQEWHQEVATKGEDFGNLSRLSVLKLLFFAAVPKNNESNEDLLNVFNNFCALPYGPVESDIYDSIKNDTLPSYVITERHIINKNTRQDNYITAEDKLVIKKAVNDLRSINSQLFLLGAFDLVDITHQWDSWKTAYNFAQFMGLQSYEMTTQSIREDRNKFFGN